MVTELAKGVYWVGVVDWGLRQFHGHELSTYRGSSYNAYLIVDEKVALVDTVWDPFEEEFLANVREIIDPARIDYVIANHAEPDHSGSLRAIMREAPNAELIVSKLGVDSITGHYHEPWDYHVVGTGDRISLGSRDLVFIEARLLHWPDSMFTYLTGDAILMPNDAFGQHYATAFRFNDQVDQKELYEEALKYYANILTPFSARVERKIQEVLALGLPVNMIAPSHGVIWRSDPLQIVHKYREWAAQVPEKRAVVLYDTMWNATRRMAEAIGEGLAEKGVDYKLFHMAVSDRNEVITEIFRSKAVVIGSPTLNRGVLPTIAPILEDLRGLGFENKVGAAFGSYGWSGEAPREIEAHLEKSHVRKVADAVSAKWQPTGEDLERCRALGRTVADAVLAD
ncbi:MAG: MBL fold metallo-hydrolase [Chloroflexi bacterium]|jgi:anaerobic nitric oxide reductase flavorubredoxin|nr:MBL fold metallo-hydrolase [Chloroflexota bacterium]